MNKNGNPHKPLRSSWKSECFTKPKTGKKVVIINSSRGRNNAGAVVKVSGGFLPKHLHSLVGA